jgi:HD superfamily phosphodiesterase
MLQDIAGIGLPDTPLISKALCFARLQLVDTAYNHVLRCIYLGVAISNRIPALDNRDRELHVVAALSHDIGWDRTETFMGTDK